MKTDESGEYQPLPQESKSAEEQVLLPVSSLESLIKSKVENHIRGGKYIVFRECLIILISAASLPLFIKTSLDYAKTSVKGLKFIVPASVISLNFLGNLLGTDKAWEGIENLVLSRTYSIPQKVARSAFAIILSGVPSISPIGTAIVESRISHSAWKYPLIIGTVLDTIPTNFFSAFDTLEFIDPIKNRCRAVPRNWEITLRIKRSLLELLEDCCKQLEVSPGDAQQISTQLTSSTEPFFTISALINRGRRWRDHNLQAVASQTRKTISVIGKVLSGVISAYTISSWSGFSCSTELFWNTYIEDERSAWATSLIFMAPLFYLTAKLTYLACHNFTTNAVRYYYNEPLSLPAAFREFPKTTVLLGSLIIFLSAFSWGTGVKLVRSHCPTEIASTFENIVYVSIPISNGVQALLALKDIINKLSQLWGNNDFKIARYIITISRSIMQDISRMAPEQFAEAILTERAAILIPQLQSCIPDIAQLLNSVRQELSQNVQIEEATINATGPRL